MQVGKAVDIVLVVDGEDEQKEPIWDCTEKKKQLISVVTKKRTQNWL